MFTQNRSFQVNQSHDKLVAVIQKATKNQHPLPIVTLDNNSEPATFSVVQRFANFSRMALIQAEGTLKPQANARTDVELRVESVTYPAIILTALQTLSIMVVYVLLRPDFNATLLMFIMILSVAFLVWDRLRYSRQFRAQMDAFFGDAWRA